MRGDGWLLERGGVWYACFVHEGRRVRQSLATTDRNTAERRLTALRRKRERGEYQAAAVRRVTVADLLDDLLVNFEVRGVRSLKKARSAAKAVRAELGHRPAAGLDSAEIERAQQEWLRAGRAPKTVNIRCDLLRQAYRLAERRSPAKVTRAPYIPRLRAENVRQGFFAPDEIARLLPLLPADLRDFVEWGWLTGMRKGEAAALTWAMVDKGAAQWRLVVPGAVTKNREARTLPLVGSLRVVIDRRAAARRLDTPLVFHRASRGRPGQPVKAFDKAWRAALAAAGISRDRLYHDLRRSAARNIRRSGASESEAMLVTGHKTPSMFRRYSIVADDEVAAALLRQDAFLARGDKRGYTGGGSKRKSLTKLR